MVDLSSRLRQRQGVLASCLCLAILTHGVADQAKSIEMVGTQTGAGLALQPGPAIEQGDCLIIAAYSGQKFSAIAQGDAQGPEIARPLGQACGRRALRNGQGPSFDQALILLQLGRRFSHLGMREAQIEGVKGGSNSIAAHPGQIHRLFEQGQRQLGFLAHRAQIVCAILRETMLLLSGDRAPFSVQRGGSVHLNPGRVSRPGRAPAVAGPSG